MSRIINNDGTKKLQKLVKVTLKNTKRTISIFTWSLQNEEENLKVKYDAGICVIAKKIVLLKGLRRLIFKFIVTLLCVCAHVRLCMCV